MKSIFSALICVFLFGCGSASHIKHLDTKSSGLPINGKKVADIRVSLSPVLTEALAEKSSNVFKPEALLSVVRAELEKAGFYSLDENPGDLTAEIVVDDIRFLNANVIMLTVPFTVLAGPDYIAGKVIVYDKKGGKLDGADIKASWVIATGHQASEELRVSAVSQGFASEVVKFFGGQKTN